MTYTIYPPAKVDIHRFQLWLAATDDLLGLDVETTAIAEDGKAQWSPEFIVRTVQLGSSNIAWVLDPNDPVGLECLGLAGRVGKRFVTHTDYDLRSLWCGLRLDLSERTVDCHVLACLTNPGGENDLKTLSAMIDTDLVDAEKTLYQRGKELSVVGERVGSKLKRFIFNEMDINEPEFVRYAGLDAIYVRRIHDLLMNKIEKDGMKHLVEREQRYHRIFVRKGIRGTRLDLGTAKEIYEETNAEHEAARERFQLATGLPALSPKRPGWLQEHGADLSNAPLTDGGQSGNRVPSLTKKVLPMLAAENDIDELRPIWQDMITVSNTKNLRDNLKKMINGADENSYGHPVTKTQGAKTGRSSVTGIPIQTFNKSDQRLRSIILADEGNVFVGADFDAIEIRVAAALSRDPILMRVLARGEDIHDNTARAIWGPRFTNEQRTIGKRASFGTLYGGGGIALSGQVSISLAKAQEIIRRLKETYPVCFDYLKKLGYSRGVVTPWGRRIPADKDRAYANGNYMIQSTAREIMVDSVLRLFDIYRIPEEWLEMCVHDEIILQVPVWAADYAIAALNAAMNINFRGVAITANATLLGPRWGRVTEKEVVT